MQKGCTLIIILNLNSANDGASAKLNLFYALIVIGINDCHSSMTNLSELLIDLLCFLLVPLCVIFPFTSTSLITLIILECFNYVYFSVVFHHKLSI